jgi:hypothetical protein
MSALVLGPLVRHTDATTSSVWVEVDRAGTVEVEARGSVARARTFRVHDHHYALVGIEGLAPGEKHPYTVRLDGEHLWPPPDSAYPPSVIATLQPGKPLRLAFGSCRTSVTHDEAGNKTHGVDALRAYALRMAGATPTDTDDDPDPGEDVRWPDLVLFLGDQVYADETTDEMREFIASRRDIDEPPGEELKDYEEYAHLYWLAWRDPANRWLLSTLPTAMIFDDHDVRDDWNTSQTWKEEMEATSWWHERIVAALSSYWVHQHLGNLTPAERAEDEIWQQICAHDGPDEYDASALLDAFAERVDQHPETYRWSFAREFDDQARLVVVDSRAARVLDPDRRSMLDPDEMAWLDQHMRGETDHLLVGTSLPFLLAPGVHHGEAWSEALAQGGWGRLGSRIGERLRQAGDMEHWAAFQDAFQQVSRMALAVARGERGRAPRTVTFLSGDVHHSYLTEAWPSSAEAGAPLQSRLLQAVCSPIRNPLGRRLRVLMAAAAYGIAPVVGRAMATSAKVPASPLRWKLTHGPWFDNVLATLEVTDTGLRLWWAKGVVEDGRHDLPRVVRVAEVEV